MTTRELIHEDDDQRVYEVSDADGKVIGQDAESKVVGEPTADERLAALESRLNDVAALADKANATAQEVAAAARPTR